MKQPIIFVDIDDTISDTLNHILSVVNDTHKTNYTPEDQTLERREGGDEEYENRIKQVLGQADAISQTKPYADALDAMKQLHEAGYEIHIVSSRKENLHQVTQQWLVDHGFADYIDRIHPRDNALSGNKFKRQTAQAIQPVAAFDDTYDVAAAMAEEGTEVYLIDKPWNNHPSIKPTANITRVPSFSEGVKLFLSHKK